MDKVISQIEEHLKAAQKKQWELLRPKTEQDAYDLYVSRTSGSSSGTGDGARSSLSATAALREKMGF